MCNACGFLCCASDQLRQCGCDCPGFPGCWERCEYCGDLTEVVGCPCDEDDEDFLDEVDVDG